MRHWIDLLTNNPLFEMAFARHDLKQHIRSLARPIGDHICKIIVMPNSIDRAHWIKETMGWLDDVNESVLKPKNKKFTAQEYFDFLFDEPFENGTGTKQLGSLARQGYKMQIVDGILVFDKMKKCYQEICPLLATCNGESSMAAIQTILDNL